MRLTAENVEEFVKSVFNRTAEPELAEINIDALSSYWRKMIEAGPGVAYGVESEGTPSGFLLASHCVDPMTGKFMAFEYLWFMSPDFRKTYGGLQLLDEFEQGAKDAGCSDAVVGCNIAYKMGALGKVYQYSGYEILSESYRKRL